VTKSTVMKYAGVCVGGPRDGQRMSHNHRVRMNEEWRNDRFIVTGPGSKEDQWITTGKYVFDAKHKRWTWEPVITPL
jgi:hypothetical protein